MSKKYLFAMILLLSAPFAPPRAIADVTDASGAALNQQGANIDAEEEAHHSLQLFRTARLSLGDAMAIAEKLHDGSRTARISFDVSGSPLYRVRTVKNDEIWENVVDAETGRVSGDEIASSLKNLSAEDRRNIIALRSARQQLTDAVLIAEKAASGKAFGGGLTNDEGKLKFIVVIVSGDRVKEVMLEPRPVFFPYRRGRVRFAKHVSL